MSISHSDLENEISERIGKPVRVTVAAFECLIALENAIPLPSWELWLLDTLLQTAPRARSQCPILIDFRYRDLLALFEGRVKFTEYDWPENASQPKIEEI